MDDLIKRMTMIFLFIKIDSVITSIVDVMHIYIYIFQVSEKESKDTQEGIGRERIGSGNILGTRRKRMEKQYKKTDRGKCDRDRWMSG